MIVGRAAAVWVRARVVRERERERESVGLIVSSSSFLQKAGCEMGNPKSFKIPINSPLATALKSSISHKLLEFLGNYTDDVLAVILFLSSSLSLSTTPPFPFHHFRLWILIILPLTLHPVPGSFFMCRLDSHYFHHNNKIN